MKFLSWVCWAYIICLEQPLQNFSLGYYCNVSKEASESLIKIINFWMHCHDSCEFVNNYLSIGQESRPFRVGHSTHFLSNKELQLFHYRLILFWSSYVTWFKPTPTCESFLCQPQLTLRCLQSTLATVPSLKSRDDHSLFKVLHMFSLFIWLPHWARPVKKVLSKFLTIITIDCINKNKTNQKKTFYFYFPLSYIHHRIFIQGKQN